jgi:4-hydroxy-tetrahydrodipicolinate reductase
MGQALIRCALGMEGVRLVGAVERPGHAAMGADAGALAGAGAAGVIITDTFEDALAAGDVAIDFALHDAVPGHARAIAAAGKRMVLGTTGLTPEESDAVRDAARRAPVVWSPNMSVGVNVLCEAVKRAAAAFGPSYRIELDETHHIHKKDAPSGTALLLGRNAAEGLGIDFDSHWRLNPEGAVPQGTIAIRSKREGEVVGDHTVRFAVAGETIEFTHHAWSRDALAAGALRAAVWLMDKPAGLYDMADVLGKT